MASPIRQDDATGLNIKTTEISTEHYQNIILTDNAGAEIIGKTSDAAVSTDTTGTLSGKLRGLVKLLVEKITVQIDSGQTIATTNAGTFAVQSTLQAGSAIAGAIKDAGANSYGTNTYTTSANMTSAADVGPAPTAGQYSVLHQATISTNTAMQFTFQMETTAGAERHSFLLPANGTVVFIPRYPIKLGTINKKWQGLASVAGTVCISVVTGSEA